MDYKDKAEELAHWCTGGSMGKLHADAVPSWTRAFEKALTEAHAAGAKEAEAKLANAEAEIESLKIRYAKCEEQLTTARATIAEQGRRLEEARAAGERKAFKFCAGFQEARIRLRKESGCECALKELENQKMIWEAKALSPEPEKPTPDAKTDGE